jgi:hypothetical protein
MIFFKRLRRSFDFKIESNSDFDESERSLLALINIKQFINTTEYPQTPFAIAKVSPYQVQQNTLRPFQSRTFNKTTH